MLLIIIIRKIYIGIALVAAWETVRGTIVIYRVPKWSPVVLVILVGSVCVFERSATPPHYRILSLYVVPPSIDTFLPLAFECERDPTEPRSMFVILYEE